MPISRTSPNASSIIFLLLFLQIKNQLAYEKTKIYWNSPSATCTRHNETGINLEKFHIISNVGQKFSGNEIVLFYEKDIGLYPAIRKYANGSHVWEHNGIPQNVNMTEHLAKVKKDVGKLIPSHSFRGLAILDFEEWRPFYDQNWSSKRIYREASIDKVMKKHPKIKRVDAIKIAKDEFDRASLDFLVKTLKECQLMRPNAKWGFYGFPICDENGATRNNTFCYPEHDNRLVEFLKYADALYPSAYLYPGRTYHDKHLFVEDVLKETARMNAMIVNEGFQAKHVFVFHKFELDPYVDNPNDILFYDKYHLCITMKQTFDYGVDGILLWSTSKNMAKRCKHISNYIEYHLGPYLHELQTFHDE
uniref:Hyaluronidase n=1 Tax=Rhabditophanes sp. KR3021 TaxID=114890 RepID=A0AC35U497_9BILA